MDFSLSDDEALIQKTVRELARGPIAGRAAALDKAGGFPTESMKDLAALGMLGPTIPEKFGGTPVSKVAFNLLLEEIAWACASTSVTAAVHASVAATPIVEWGSPATQERFLPKLASDPSYLARNNMEWVGDGANQRLRQAPGPDNPLGPQTVAVIARSSPRSTSVTPVC